MKKKKHMFTEIRIYIISYTVVISGSNIEFKCFSPGGNSEAKKEGGGGLHF